MHHHLALGRPTCSCIGIYPRGRGDILPANELITSRVYGLQRDLHDHHRRHRRISGIPGLCLLHLPPTLNLGGVAQHFISQVRLSHTGTPEVCVHGMHLMRRSCGTTHSSTARRCGRPPWCGWVQLWSRKDYILWCTPPVRTLQRNVKRWHA